MLGTSALAAYEDSEQYVKREEIAAIIAACTATRSSAEWLEILSEKAIWCAPVNDYDEVERDPQVIHNGHLKTIPSATGAPITLVTHPIQYDGETPNIPLPPQPLGRHTAEIMRAAGYSDSEIERLESDGVIELQREKETSP